MISSTFSPSASALKLGRTRCLRMGPANDCTSPIFGDGLPSRTALAFAPKTRYCDAQGPAPQSTDIRMKSGARSELGLVEADSFTAYSTTLSETGTLRIRS